MRSDIELFISLCSGNRGQTERVNTAAGQMDLRRLFYLCFPLKWWRIFSVGTNQSRYHQPKASFSFLAIFCKRLSRVQIKAGSVTAADARRWASI
jgi:hypothetical protein